MSYEQKFLLSLLLTIVIEIPVALIIIKYIYKKIEIKISSIIFVGFLASATTLPYFWFVIPAFISSRIGYIVIGEAIIIVAEAIIYNKLLKIKPSESFFISFTANIASMLFGLLF